MKSRFTGFSQEKKQEKRLEEIGKYWRTNIGELVFLFANRKR